jgi:GTP pyrophosphokinase
MKTKNIPFEEIYDLLAVRIIYKTQDNIGEKDQAWMIYSTVTNFYRPHPERIRDWVSTPKANGYEALHVTVMGPAGQWIEVQIRSERMHEIAEKGISAHWKYKTGENSPETELDNWLKTIKEILDSPEPSAIDFLDTFKLNLFSTEIFVFTPKGEIKTLPQNATALDFAFSLHSDLGMQCIGAKVNHKLVPLSHTLESGDQVEILTSKKQSPQPEWINYVTTARAKTKLKSAFKKENRAIIAKGKLILDEKFKDIKLPLDNQTIQRLLNYFKLNQRDELYYELGKGVISLVDIEKKIFKQKSGFRWMNYWKLQFGSSKKQDEEPAETEKKNPLHKIDRKKTLKLTDDIQGEVQYKIAECCNPIPGDDVLGYINDDETVTLHKRQCPVAAKLKSNFGERLVSAEWTSKKILSFPAILEIRGIDAQGVLIQIIKVISQDYEVNIQKINLETKDGIFVGRFNIFVHGTEDVNNLCMNILKIKAVNSVKRIEDEVTEKLA